MMYMGTLSDRSNEMLNKTKLKHKAMLAALLSVAVACGSVQEAAQSKAVRDRSRVLGLALMEDGTYQFRLCRLHENYTAEILANECINPLINADGTERVFSSVPEKPGTALAKLRNWITAALAGTIAGILIYKVGRFYVKTKAGDRLVGKARLLNHKVKIDGAKAKNDFELVEKIGELGEGSAVVGGKDFTNAIAFVKSYGKEVEGNIATARKAIREARNKDLQTNLDKAYSSLQEASEVLQRADTGFSLDNKPMQDLTQAITALAKQADELRQAGGKGIASKLRAMEEEASIIYARVHRKEGLRLQLSKDELDKLDEVAEKDSALAKILQNWKQNKTELNLLDGSDELEKNLLKLKDNRDELVEKLLRIDDVASKSDSEKTIRQLNQDVDNYSKALENNKKDVKLSAQLDEAKAQLKGRIKSYNSVQRETSIKQYREKVDKAIKADPVRTKVEKTKKEAVTQQKDARGGEDGLLADGLGKVSTKVKGSVKLLDGFPWFNEETLKYSKLNKITVTDEDKLVTKLAHDIEINDIDVQKGAEKLAAQAVGISAFLSLPLTAWSRYLPAHALLTAEKNWTEVTGGYATAKRIDDMLAVLDGIAQATDSRVSQAALTFGL